jgi:hypothetical protein
MPNVTQRTVRTTQPQTAVGIDYANPITRGLVACLDANRRVLINGSETRPLTLTNPARRASQQEFGTVTLQTAMQAIKAPPAASSNVTMLSIFIPSTEITERTYGQLGQTNSGNMLSVSSGDGATAGVVRFKIYLGSMRTIGASQANEGVPNLAIARHINGQSQNLWLNGVKDASSGAFTGNSIGFGFYGFATSSGMSGASILNAVWNRALTDAEIKSLSENPWQIFVPERRVIAFDVSAGGAVDSIVSTGQAQKILASNNRYLSSIASLSQVQAAYLATNRILDFTIATKQVESSLSEFSLTLDCVFSSQTQQAQSSHSEFNRSISASSQTRQAQKSEVTTIRAINSIVGLSQAQKTNALLSTSLDATVFVSQSQSQSTISSYALSVNAVATLKQAQSSVIATTRVLDSSITTNQAEKTIARFSFVSGDFVPSIVRSYVVTIETRRYSIPTENRSFVV